MKRLRGIYLKKVRFGVVLASVLLYFFVGTVPVNAASNSLGVTPRKSYTINPGGSVNDTLYVNNLSKTSALTVSLKAVDFTAQGQSGTPDLLVSPNPPSETYSLKPYLKLTNSVTIQPSSADYVPISIKIPPNLGAGSYYSAVLYQANVGGGKQLTLAASAATLIFVTVPGKASELLNLVKYGAYVPNSTGTLGTFQSLYISTQPTELAYVLHNQGNVAENPQGSIVIKNQYGKVVDTINQANPDGDLALIGQTRLFSTCIKPGQKQVTGGGQTIITQVCANPNLAPGRYSAYLETLYGINGNTSQEISATATFWYLPTWFIAILIAIVVILIAAVIVVVHAFKKHRKHKKHTS